MANRFKVESHPQRKQIVKDLINQVPYLAIASKYDLSETSVRRYAYGRLYQNAAKLLESGQYDGANLLARIEDTIVNVQKMYDACDDWLTDPDHPEKYSLDPRAEELKVIYTKQEMGDDGEMHTERATKDLQALLDMVEDEFNYDIKAVETKRADPRSLVLQTAQVMSKQLELLGKVAGVVKEAGNVTVNIDNSTKIVTKIVQIIERETMACPDVRQRIVEGLSDAVQHE